MQIVMINDNFVPTEEVEPIYFDRGNFFGDGVYEVLRSYNGKLFALEEHLQRFARSLKAIHIAGIDIDIIKQRVLTAFKKADIPNAKIYFHITRGSAPRSHTWDEKLKPNFFLNISQIAEDTQAKNEGIAVSTYPDLRWKRCDIKSLNLLANVLARQDAVQKGCAEAILVNEKGLITEGAATSFFAIFDETLRISPLSANVLPSITRKYALQAVENIKLKIDEESLTPAEAVKADELFIAGTTIDILAVIKFDGQTIADGKPGKYTKQLANQFELFAH